MKIEMTINKPTLGKRKRFDPFLLLVFLLIICLTGFMGKVIITLPMGLTGLADDVAALQQQSGVTSPVTAVLLNFRGYDTLLEIMVLLLAVIGVWSLTAAPTPPLTHVTSPVQIAVVRLLTPLMILVAAYLVWQGDHLAGGAFQGGAVLGGAGVLLLVAEIPLLRIPSLPLRLGLLCGPLVFLGVAIFCLFTGAELLHYPRAFASPLLLLIETACAISIGITLTCLFAGGRPEELLNKKMNVQRRTSNFE